MAIEMEKGSVSIDAQNIMPVIKRWLYSDKDIFLREVVSNGCDAITKFRMLNPGSTEPMSVTVTVDKEAQELRISDTGIGIPEEAKERIFDRFYKVDSFVQGAGLGLAVCRHYALSLDGNVGMESLAGQGSTFWVDIPVSAGAAKD